MDMMTDAEWSDFCEAKTQKVYGVSVAEFKTNFRNGAYQEDDVDAHCNLMDVLMLFPELD